MMLLVLVVNLQHPVPVPRAPLREQQVEAAPLARAALLAGLTALAWPRPVPLFQDPADVYLLGTADIPVRTPGGLALERAARRGLSRGAGGTLASVPYLVQNPWLARAAPAIVRTVAMLVTRSHLADVLAQRKLPVPWLARLALMAAVPALLHPALPALLALRLPARLAPFWPAPAFAGRLAALAAMAVLLAGLVGLTLLLAVPMPALDLPLGRPVARGRPRAGAGFPLPGRSRPAAVSRPFRFRGAWVLTEAEWRGRRRQYPWRAWGLWLLLAATATLGLAVHGSLPGPAEVDAG
ncbi:MAG: hypothetical protein OWV35_13160, partial [Firmicutes bacterium]|nr:hypothetical protein [Bacillota bacterium]